MGTLRPKQEGARTALSLSGDGTRCQRLLVLYWGYEGPCLSPSEQCAKRAQTPGLGHLLLLPPWRGRNEDRQERMCST